MSNDASAFFSTQYANRAMAIYQQEGGKLRGTISSPTRFMGSEKARFYLAGKSVATEVTGPRQLLVPSGQPITPFDVTLRDFNVFDEVYKFDEARLSIDEKEIIYANGAMAMGRKTDMLILEAAFAAQSTVTVDASSGQFKVSHLTKMIAAGQRQVKRWDNQWYLPLPVGPWNDLMMNKLFTEAGYVGAGDLPYASATETRSWRGLKVFLLEEEDAEDLYPQSGSGTKQDIVMYHKSALGWAPHTDMEVTTGWHNEISTLSISMNMRGAAAALQQGNGIVRATVLKAETAAVVDG